MADERDTSDRVTIVETDGGGGGGGVLAVVLLVIAYAARRMPYVVRSAVAGLQQTPRDLELAASNLGAGRAGGYGNQTVIVAFNNDTRPATFEIALAENGPGNNARLVDRLEVVKGELRVENNALKVTLPARSASIFTVRENR